VLWSRSLGRAVNCIDKLTDHSMDGKDVVKTEQSVDKQLHRSVSIHAEHEEAKQRPRDLEHGGPGDFQTPVESFAVVCVRLSCGFPST
jgi:hypothetical protein